LAIAALSALATSAQAAPAPAPGLKLLTTSAPTNLPPVQSEVQRVTVEGEGGSFTLGHSGVQGEGTPVLLKAKLSTTAGSKVATIESITGGGTVEAGDRITIPEFFEGTTILSCSSDCETPGSTIELSESATSTETEAPREIYTRKLTDVTSSFEVGEEISKATCCRGFV